MEIVTVKIGRTSGPITDRDVGSDFTSLTTHDVEMMKDIMGMVNSVMNGKEDWWIQFGDGPMIIPSLLTKKGD